MTDIRRTILWVIFGFSLVMLWDQWQVYNGKPATFFPRAPTKTASAPAQPASSSVPTASSAATPQASTATQAAPDQPPTTGAPAAAGEKIVVTTDLMKLAFDTDGGSLIRTEFLKEPGDNGEGNFVLLNENAGHMYVAESGLIGGDYPNHKTVMTFSGDKQLKDGQDSMFVRFVSFVL